MSGADPRVRAVLKLAPVIPVYTPESVDEAVHVAQALFNGGLPVIEVTLRTAVAIDAIQAMVEAVPDAVVGAGTVLSAAHRHAAAKLGAGHVEVVAQGPEYGRRRVGVDLQVAPVDEIGRAHV